MTTQSTALWLVGAGVALAAISSLSTTKYHSNPLLNSINQQYPQYQNEIQLFVSRDPSKKLKYLEWELRILESRKALENEIADVVDLFHRHSAKLQVKDIYQYSPNDFTKLRDTLFAIRDQKNQKEKKREERYRLSEQCESEIIYESENFVVRQILNKAASIHFGLGTKWCISMKADSYYEDYESNNTVMYFMFRKRPIGDKFDKLAIIFTRTATNKLTSVDYYNSVDDQVSIVKVRHAYAHHIEELFKIEQLTYYAAYYASQSVLSKLSTGTASTAETAKTFNWLLSNDKINDIRILHNIAGSPGATTDLLTYIDTNAPAIVHKIAIFRYVNRTPRAAEQEKRWLRELRMIIYAHHQTSAGLRLKLYGWLRMRNVDVSSIKLYHSYEDGIIVQHSPIRKRKKVKLKPLKRGWVRRRRAVETNLRSWLTW